MIDNFALAVSHGLMLLAAWALLTRRDLNDVKLPFEQAAPKPPAA